MKKINLELQLFGKIELKYNEEYEELVHKLKKCILKLEEGYERMTNNQREIFHAVSYITVLRKNKSKKFQACAKQGIKTIEFNPVSIMKNKTGGLIWLICHESYHIWDTVLERREGNANLFANKIKILFEKEPAIYKWNLPSK